MVNTLCSFVLSPISVAGLIHACFPTFGTRLLSSVRLPVASFAFPPIPLCPLQSPYIPVYPCRGVSLSVLADSLLYPKVCWQITKQYTLPAVTFLLLPIYSPMPLAASLYPCASMYRSLVKFGTDSASLPNGQRQITKQGTSPGKASWCFLYVARGHLYHQLTMLI